jgi:hypothetical protein
MLVPPSISFTGNQKVATSLKNRAMKFYSFVTNQAEVGGVSYVNRTLPLDDGSIIKVTSYKEGNYGLRTGQIEIFGFSNIETIQNGKMRVSYADKFSGDKSKDYDYWRVKRVVHTGNFNYDIVDQVEGDTLFYDAKNIYHSGGSRSGKDALVDLANPAFSGGTSGYWISTDNKTTTSWYGDVTFNGNYGYLDGQHLRILPVSVGQCLFIVYNKEEKWVTSERDIIQNVITYNGGYYTRWDLTITIKSNQNSVELDHLYAWSNSHTIRGSTIIMGDARTIYLNYGPNIFFGTIPTNPTIPPQSTGGIVKYYFDKKQEPEYHWWEDYSSYTKTVITTSHCAFRLVNIENQYIYISQRYVGPGYEYDLYKIIGDTPTLLESNTNNYLFVDLDKELYIYIDSSDLYTANLFIKYKASSYAASDLLLTSEPRVIPDGTGYEATFSLSGEGDTGQYGYAYDGDILVFGFRNFTLMIDTSSEDFKYLKLNYRVDRYYNTTRSMGILSPMSIVPYTK